MSDDLDQLEDVLREMSAAELSALCVKMNIQAAPTLRASHMRVKVLDFVEGQLEAATEVDDSLFAMVRESVGAVRGREDRPPKLVRSEGPPEDTKASEAGGQKRQRAGDQLTPDATQANQLPGIYSPAIRAQLTDAYRRQYKIVGSIGGDAGLSYSSIMSQVRDGQRMGYRDHEIVAGLKLATSAKASRLRGFLDIASSLTVEKVLKFVREHLQEKTASELLDDLSNLAQSKDESDIDFMIRCFEVREKVTAATQLEDYTLDPKLIYTKFCRSVCTGFMRETIRARMKMMLDPAKPPVEYEDLLREVNVTSSECKESEEKHKREKVSVKAVQFEEENKELHQRLANSDQRSARMAKQLNALEARLAEPAPPARRQQRYGGRCKPCREARKERCNHCFNCNGEDGHYARDCPKSENLSRLRK